MELNEQQREYIKQQKPTVLTACPGSGKTTSIAYKFVELKKTWNYKHKGIALLSFTNVASEELNEKINSIEISGIGYPHYIGTIDSFFNDILLRFGYLIYSKRPIIIIELDKSMYSGWTSKCHSCIAEDIDFNFTIDGKFVRKRKEINCGLRRIKCKEFLCGLLKKGIITQSNVPYVLSNLFSKFPQVVNCVVNRFPILFLDEAQDISREQMKILDILIENGISIDYIGDPDQAIYEWRDADSSCFIEKMNDNRWEKIQYTINNRSSQIICDSTKGFGNNISKVDIYHSDSIYKGCNIKPILLLYENSSFDDIENWYIKKCNSLNIPITKNDVAIVQRSKVLQNREKNVFKTKFTNLIAKSCYDFFYGNRRKAITNMKEALAIILNEEDICDAVNKKYGSGCKTIEDLLMDFLKIIVSPDIALEKWIGQIKLKLVEFMEKEDLKNCTTFDIQKQLKIKSRGKCVDFKEKELTYYFCDDIDKKYHYSTIHGVKGKTFDSILLYIPPNSKKLTSKTLLSQDKSGEEARLAYVAMTRPRKLLVVAVNKRKNYSNMFTTNFWDYVEID